MKYNKEEWTNYLIELHQSINWAERGYLPYQVENTEIRMPCTLISENGAVATVYATFVLELSANPIYAPKYVTKEFEPFKGYLSGMYDGHKVGKYMVMDRFETQEVYDRMSD